MMGQITHEKPLEVGGILAPEATDDGSGIIIYRRRLLRQVFACIVIPEG